MSFPDPPYAVGGGMESVEMNEQERQVISDIFRRLESVANQPRDPEAERYIAEMIRRQPYAPYAMAQAVFVQEQAVTNLNAQVQELQAENERLRREPQGGGGLLSSIFGGGRPEPEPRRGHSYGAPQDRQSYGGPWGQAGTSVPQAGGYGGQPGYGAPQGGPFGGGGMGGPFGGGRGGGGFLQTAMATAVGAAGGMMLGSALANAFDGNGGGGHETGGGLGAMASNEGPSEGGGITDSLYPASGNNEEGGLGDFGGDAGDDGDWT